MRILVHSTRGTRWFDFSSNSPVAEDVKEVAKAFDFSPAHHYGVLLSGNTVVPLPSDQTLDSCGLQEGSALFFTLTSCSASESD